MRDYIIVNGEKIPVVRPNSVIHPYTKLERIAEMSQAIADLQERLGIGEGENAVSITSDKEPEDELKDELILCSQCQQPILHTEEFRLWEEGGPCHERCVEKICPYCHEPILIGQSHMFVPVKLARSSSASGCFYSDVPAHTHCCKETEQR